GPNSNLRDRSANDNATPSPFSGVRHRVDLSYWMRGLLGDSTAFRQPLLAFSLARGSLAPAGGAAPATAADSRPAGRFLGSPRNGPAGTRFRLVQLGFSLACRFCLGGFLATDGGGFPGRLLGCRWLDRLGCGLLRRGLGQGTRDRG